MYEEKKAFDFVAVHVGERIRLRRTVIGMSQELLGNRVGVTFQKIAEYERGLDRFEANNLQLIANTLGVPIPFFFRETSKFDKLLTKSANQSTIHYLSTMPGINDGLELNHAFMKIRDSSIRHYIIQLVKALSENPNSQ